MLSEEQSQKVDEFLAAAKTAKEMLVGMFTGASGIPQLPKFLDDDANVMALTMAIDSATCKTNDQFGASIGTKVMQTAFAFCIMELVAMRKAAGETSQDPTISIQE